ncbi:MAG: 3-dehydroquinate synthase, partial [Clostridia bacterium]
MDSIKVECRSRSYDVVVGQNLDDIIFEVVSDRHALIVTDNEVYSLYKDKFERILPQAEVFEVRSGEKSKSESALFDLLEFMIKNGYDRRSCLLAIGGGVIGDLTGFAASIYMRGIDYIQIPTTLLAQVDSSVGGKTAINLSGVKNAVGTFYQPRAVVADVDFLKSLDQREIISGIGEIVKTAGLNEELFNFVEENMDKLKALDLDVIEQAVTRCIKIKADIVKEDERENKSIRNKLNLGHTIGHALEMSARFLPKSHGEYVLIGIYFEAEIADKINRIDKEYKVRLQNLVAKALGEVPDFGSTDKI